MLSGLAIALVGRGRDGAFVVRAAINDLVTPVVLVGDRRVRGTLARAPCGHGGAALGSSLVDDPADAPHE